VATTRSTKQREVLRRIIEHKRRPLSPTELHDFAREELPSISLATIYRSLRLFQDEGFVQEVQLPGEQPRYETTDRGHHHHFHCDRCDRAFDLPDCPGEAVAAMAPQGFRVTDHDITLYGLCRDCATGREVHAGSEPNAT